MSEFGPVPKRGETTDSARQPDLRGAEFYYPNSVSLTSVVRDARRTKYIWVLNDSGGALLPGRAIVFKTGAFGSSIAGYAASTDVIDGVIDWTLPAAGVADQTHCWVAVEGPAYVVSDGSSTLSFRDKLICAGSGKIKKQNASPADAAAALVQANLLAGLAEEAVTNVDGTTFWMNLRR